MMKFKTVVLCLKLFTYKNIPTISGSFEGGPLLRKTKFLQQIQSIFMACIYNSPLCFTHIHDTLNLIFVSREYQGYLPLDSFKKQMHVDMWVTKLACFTPPI